MTTPTRRKSWSTWRTTTTKKSWSTLKRRTTGRSTTTRQTKRVQQGDGQQQQGEEHRHWRVQRQLRQKKMMTVTKIPSQKDLLHIWSWSIESLLLRRRRTMTMTKISSQTTCYTYGHGPLKILVHQHWQHQQRGVQRQHWQPQRKGVQHHQRQPWHGRVLNHNVAATTSTEKANRNQLRQQLATSSSATTVGNNQLNNNQSTEGSSARIRWQPQLQTTTSLVQHGWSTSSCWGCVYEINMPWSATTTGQQRWWNLAPALLSTAKPLRPAALHLIVDGPATGHPSTWDVRGTTTSSKRRRITIYVPSHLSIQQNMQFFE